MLGWHIAVYRQGGRGRAPARWGTTPGDRLAVWQAGVGGLGWLDALVEEGRAVDLGGDGYPRRWSARAGDVLAAVDGGPPEANDTWVSGAHDVLLPGWDGRTVVHEDVARACEDEEWLLVEAWDES